MHLKNCEQRNYTIIVTFVAAVYRLKLFHRWSPVLGRGGHLFFYHALFVQLIKKIRHAGAGFFSCHVVFLAELFG